MVKGAPYYLLIPVKVLVKLPELEKFFQHIPGYSLDNLKHIISIVATHVRKYDEKDLWAPLKMEYLRKVVPQADQYIKKLIDLLIVEKSDYYQVGVTAYKYRFAMTYQSEYSKRLLKNPKNIIRIEKFQQNLKKRNSLMYPGQNEYIRKLTILQEAIDFANSIKKLKKYNYALASIARIKNGDIYYIVDKTAGRYHSNLTNLPKELRQFIRIDGKALVNLDIKNCQPYLSTLILYKPKKAKRFTKDPIFSMMLEYLQVNQTEDVKRYVSLVVEGQLYEYLIEEFKKRGIGLVTRDKVKKQLLQILFDKNNHNPFARKIFAELFPEVHRVFCIVRGNDRSENNKINFKRFPILLQRLESHIILNIILHRINTELPGTIAVTIHDSVMTEDHPDKIEKVKQIMIEEFTKIIGNSPTIKVERAIEEEKEKIEEGKEREEGKKEEEGKEGKENNEAITMLEPLYVADRQINAISQFQKPLINVSDCQLLT